MSNAITRETSHNTYVAQPLSHNTSDKVIEPHTGLPMNVGKYGDGHGGTDANPTVHGLHQHGSGAEQGLGAAGADTYGTGSGTHTGTGLSSHTGTGAGTHTGTGVGSHTGTGTGAGTYTGTGTATDWSDVKKADTPY